MNGSLILPVILWPVRQVLSGESNPPQQSLSAQLQWPLLTPTLSADLVERERETHSGSGKERFRAADPRTFFSCVFLAEWRRKNALG